MCAGRWLSSCGVCTLPGLGYTSPGVVLCGVGHVHVRTSNESWGIPQLGSLLSPRSPDVLLLDGYTIVVASFKADTEVGQNVCRVGTATLMHSGSHITGYIFALWALKQFCPLGV